VSDIVAVLEKWETANRGGLLAHFNFLKKVVRINAEGATQAGQEITFRDT
jgi:hypothetical protein